MWWQHHTGIGKTYARSTRNRYLQKEHDITVLQTGRYNEILEKRGAQGEQCGMSAEFVKVIFEAIHEESVRQQMEIINK